VNEARAVVLVPPSEPEPSDPELWEGVLVEVGLAPAVFVEPPPQALARTAAASTSRTARRGLLALEPVGRFFVTLIKVTPSG
jgi:hypothetical protein